MAVAVLTWLVARRMPGAPAALRRWSAAIALATVLALTAVETLAPVPWFVGASLANHCALPCDAPPCDTPPCDCYFCWAGGDEAPAG